MRPFLSSMARARPVLFALLAVTAACGGPAASSPIATAPTAPTATAIPTATTPSAPWTELRVSWDFGPCPDDGRSCHQLLTVHPDGGFVAAETPNLSGSGSGGAADPVRRFASLTPDETRDLHQIVDAPGFLDKLGSFDCAPDPDASVSVEVDSASGPRKQGVGGCVHSSDASPNAVRALVALLERHRFAQSDAQPAHPRLPSAAGDSCNPSTGCAAGLVCVVAPCVVAPCTNGTCQASR
jgi:hypothetical protein